MTDTDLIPGPGAQLPAVSIDQVIQHAVSCGLAPDGLEKLMELYERHQDRQARADWVDAMNAFQTAHPEEREGPGRHA